MTQAECEELKTLWIGSYEYINGESIVDEHFYLMYPGITDEAIAVDVFEQRYGIIPDKIFKMQGQVCCGPIPREN